MKFWNQKKGSGRGLGSDIVGSYCRARQDLNPCFVLAVKPITPTTMSAASARNSRESVSACLRLRLNPKGRRQYLGDATYRRLILFMKESQTNASSC